MLTDEEVSEEDFLNAWSERFEAIKEAANKKMRQNAERRSQKLRPAAGGDGPGGSGEGEA